MLPLLMMLFLTAFIPESSAAEADSLENRQKTVRFRFIPGDDMFYLAREGNAGELERLYAWIDRYRTEIVSGALPVYVDAYTASMRDRRANLRLSFTRANRVKSELIVHKQLKEEHFITKNYASAYTDPDGTIHKNTVVVTIRLPEEPKPEETQPDETKAETPVPLPAVKTEEEPSYTDSPFTAVDPTPETASAEIPSRLPSIPFVRGWFTGLNIGMPFFWGDFRSTAADKSYIGVGVGIFGGYRFNSWLGVSLSLDYAQNKTGPRAYAAHYFLDPQGMTWYTPQAGTTRSYDELYGQIGMFSVGLHAELNANRAFGRRAAGFPLKLIVSPAIYANTFSPKIFTRTDDKKYVEGNHSHSLSLGLGGDVAVRYDLSPTIGVQLKGTGMWINDNGFDNIRTVGSVKQNAYWGISAGVIWYIDTKQY